MSPDKNMIADKIHLRPSTPEDETFVNNLTRNTMRSYVESTWTSEKDREHYYHINKFDLPKTSIICLENERIGRLTLTKSDLELVIEDIHIVPEFQGQGIGKHLIEKLIEEAHANDQSVLLMVLKTNPAKKLYDRLGFRIYDETEERYYMRCKK